MIKKKWFFICYYLGSVHDWEGETGQVEELPQTGGEGNQPQCAHCLSGYVVPAEVKKNLKIVWQKIVHDGIDQKW